MHEFDILKGSQNLVSALSDVTTTIPQYGACFFQSNNYIVVAVYIILISSTPTASTTTCTKWKRPMIR